MPLATQRDHWGKRDASLSAGDSQYPHSTAGRLSGFWYVPGASLRLTPWLYSQKLENFDPAKGLVPIQTGEPPPQKKAFAKSGEKTQNFLYVGSFMALSQNPDLRDLGHMCLSVASLSPVPLCLSPSDFLDEPYLTFRIHMTSRKEF